MTPSTNNPILILASASPRRKDLLKTAGLNFTVIPSTLDENGEEEDSPLDHAQNLARAKSAEIAAQYPDSWVLGADTLVTDGKTIMGKPESPDHAKVMLSRLSGRSHQVVTGFCLIKKNKARQIVRVVSTTVFFRELTADEISWYVSTQEPFDKAGAYGIQGLGSFMVKEIHGSYTNVVGLPVCEVVEILTREGVLDGRYDRACRK